MILSNKYKSVIHKYKNLYSEFSKKRNKELIILSLLLGAGICIWSLMEHDYIKKHGLYTIGIAENLSGGGGGFSSTMSFRYEEKIYKKRVGLGDLWFDYPDRQFKRNGERFFIQFLPHNPKRFIVLDIVPDCIPEAPPEGWGILPDCPGN
ncbi:hypothetical protein AGMMS50239_25560 [Bacteroidia bacterium]|nr:hypothetical protein AGMMS50239_25560 [Bacteroidia bacterium]GHV29720.1 hypothetical protein FACS1894177_01070 [Bacteroidia bacterium]